MAVAITSPRLLEVGGTPPDVKKGGEILPPGPTQEVAGNGGVKRLLNRYREIAGRREERQRMVRIKDAPDKARLAGPSKGTWGGEEEISRTLTCLRTNLEAHRRPKIKSPKLNNKRMIKRGICA